MCVALRGWKIGESQNLELLIVGHVLDDSLDRGVILPGMGCGRGAGGNLGRPFKVLQHVFAAGNAFCVTLSIEKWLWLRSLLVPSFLRGRVSPMSDT